MPFIKSMLFALSIPAIAVLAGCQSNGEAKTDSGQATSMQAVACEKCKVTYVQLPQMAKNRVVGYTTRKNMECPECRSAAENFFATGKLEHSCKTCGDNMSICESH